MQKISRSVGLVIKKSLRDLSHYRPGHRHLGAKADSNKNILNIVVLVALSINIVSIGVPALLSVYNDQQSKIPRALIDDAKTLGQLAADAVPSSGKATLLAGGVKNQLESEHTVATQGKPRDLTRIKKLDEGRTENDTVFQNADGSKTLERSMQATSYKDSSGNWKDVDSSLSKDSDGKWKTKDNAWQARFGQIDTQGVELAKDAQTFTLKPIGGKSVKPVVSGTAPHQIITYPNVWQGVDLQYQVTGSQLKESIVIKSRAAQSSFQFASSGASLSVDPSGGWYTLDGALTGYKIAAPTVATFKQGVIGGSPFVNQTASGSTVTIVLDQAWLQKRALDEFPIVIDPTLVAWSKTGNWYRNFKSDGTICDPGQGCGNSTGNASNYMWRFAYHVEFPQLSGQYVVGASLHLEMPNPDGVHYYGQYGGRVIYVDHAACLNSINCIDGSYGETAAVIGSSGDIDVTPQYRTAADGADWGNWMMVRGEEAINYESYKLFAYDMTRVSFNYETLPSQSLIASSGTPVDGGVSVSTQPTLRSNPPATDPDGPGPNQYRYIIGTSKGNLDSRNRNSAIGGVVADSGLTSLPQWTVPDNVLQDGTTYYWQAAVWDSYAGSAQIFSPVYSFKIDLRNGKDATQAFDTVGAVSADMATGNLTTSAKTHSVAALGGSLGVGLDYNSPQRSRPGLVGEYFNNASQSTTFPATTDTAALTRVEPNVDFNWSTTSPYNGVITNDWFKARWSGYFIAPAAGTYSFGGNNDDRMAVTVNNILQYDNGGCYTGVCYGATTIALTAGQVVPIKIEYLEATGAAFARAFVKGPVTEQVIQNTWLQTGIRPIATPHGLVGKYYTYDPVGVPAGQGPTFPTDPSDPTRIFLSRTDPSLSMDWGTGSPVPNGPADNFMVRWSGYITPTTTDTYLFGVNGDDGSKVTIGSTVAVDNWAAGALTPTYSQAAPMTLNANQSYPITIDYYDKNYGARFSLLAKKGSQAQNLDTSAYVIDSSILAPKAQVLPDGWNLAIDADGNLGYDFAVIGQNSVVLRDSTGNTHEYKWNGTGFAPPVNEDGNLVRNGDGSVTFQDSDGRTYVFNSDGTLKLSSTPVDDRQPAALQYTYGTSSGSAIPRITQITDGVTTSRWTKVFYSGDTGCLAVPTGFSAVPANMICAVISSDGNTTQFAYSSNGRLGRLMLPGNELTDYGYDAQGRIIQLRDSLANDAILAAVRTQDGTETTNVAYDAIGRVSSVTMPAANAGDTRQAHNYGYQIGVTSIKIANATEPNGFTRQVAYDATYRTTTDADVANLVTTTQWDPVKDLVLSTTDPAGLKSTTKYDYTDRPIDQYGPAPSAWFDANNVPLSANAASTPHSQTGYDESINGLASAYYNVGSATNGTGVSTKLLQGAPKLHATGVGLTSGDIIKTWGAAAPITPDTGMGWGARLSGDLHMMAAGNYTFRVKSDDGARLWIDDTLVVDDWADGVLRNHPNGTYNNNHSPADWWPRIRVDYYNKAGDSDAQLEIYMTAPGATETSAIGSILKPHYGLTTSQTVYDTQVGNFSSTTSYGTNPELGLAQSNNLDPTGLNYTSSSTYEAQGAGSYLRQTSKTLPGSTTTNYFYYAATDTVANPCVTGSTAVNQGGMLKLKTEADPDGAGPQFGRSTETTYDTAGRIVATRLNADQWTCTTYDARGRVTQVSIPNNNGGDWRTVTNNWAVGGNPLVVSSDDPNGTITTTSDLLGRTVSYMDAYGNWTGYGYDAIGRLIRLFGDMGEQGFVYDNLNRLISQSFGGVVVANPYYDAYGRLSSVNYPTAGQEKLGAITRDSLGRTTGLSYTLGNGTTTISDSVTLSQSGKVLSGTENGSAKTYSYDKAGRLTAATMGTSSFSYGFGTPTACTGTFNSNAGKNANRTTTSRTIAGTTTSQTYCYNNADQLVSSSDPKVGVPTYDPHGNTVTLGSVGTGTTKTTFGYDSSDRNSYITENDGQTAIYYNRDVQNRVMSRFKDNNYWATEVGTWYGFTGAGDAPDFTRDANGTVTEQYLQLPGGVLMTMRPTLAGNAQRVFSLPNVHGDIMATTDAAGVSTGSYSYDPFGQVLGSSTANNSADSVSFGWVGQHEKDSEVSLALAPVQMGARVYIPSLGRFTSVDPVEGGVENNYVYPPDPVNDFDLNGDSVWNVIKLVTAVASVGSMIPGPIGMASSAVAAAGYALQGDYKSAALYGAGIALAAVGAGAALGAIKVASLTVKTNKAATFANKALTAIRIGGRGIGFGKNRIALHAPHNIAKRLSPNNLHQGSWHIHVGPSRTARYVVRFWRKFRG
jgi:RHS repeat-associated protein